MEKHPEYAAVKWAKMLQVSLSGYHEYQKRKAKKERPEKVYKGKIMALFNQSRNTYRVDKICALLRKAQHKASYKRVKSVIEGMGLVSIHRKRRQRSLTDSRKSRGEGYANLTKGLEITKPFQVVSSDITYIRTDEGFGYVCQVKDVASGVVLAEYMAGKMKSELVIDTIKQAVKRWHLP